MKIKEKIENHVAILSVTGNMMGGPETTALHEHVKGLINDGIVKVVIDLSGVKWMNSSGLGTLMACHSSLQAAGGDLRLANVADKVQSLFMITKLVKIFQTFETVDRAVASFSDD
jgi:anti-sigma B factor antagonist